MQVVTGAGPVGTTVAEQLAAAGHQVRVLTRSGSGPVAPGIERLAVDVRDEPALTAALEGASAVYHCTHAAYDAKTWERELPAAEQVVLRAAGDRVVVFPESLYAYTRTSASLTEDDPRDARTGKRGIRSRLLQARGASATPTVSVVASDFFGPHVRNAHAGDRMVKAVLAGKKLRVLGSPDQPHSFTYVPDLAKAMIAAAADPDRAGLIVHAPTAPAVTQRQLMTLLAAAADTTPKIGTIPSWAMRTGARVNTPMRELAEMLYQFEHPFVMSSDASEHRLGLAATPLETAARETVAWWRTQP